MSPDQQVALVAESQHGLLTHTQAQRSGCTDRMIEWRVASGVWCPIFDGVYRMAGAPVSWGQRMLAAVLAAGPGAVASHGAAARLWELDGFNRSPGELSVTRPKFHRLGDIVVHRSTDLDRSPATARFGVPVTSVARTILDLGAVARLGRVETAMECALGRKLVTLGRLRAELEAFGRRGRRGAGVLRQLLDERGMTSSVEESVLEARMLRLLRTHGLPMPVCQCEVRVGERLLGRADFAYPEHRVVIEVDGYESHSSLAAFRRDRLRQNDLVEAGWVVLRFTWDDVRNHPEQVAARIRRVLVALDHSKCGSARQERFSASQLLQPSGSQVSK